MGCNALRDGRVDGVFGDVTLGAEVIIPFARIFGQSAALFLHLVCRLPGTGDDFTHTAHGLTVRRNDRKRAKVMQDVFGGDGFAADAAFGKGHIFGNFRIKVMADHQHVQMLVNRVDRKWTCRVGRAWQNVGFATQLDDIRRMATTGTLGMEGVNGAPLKRCASMFDKAAFIQRIGMNHDLNIKVIGNRKAGINRGWCRAPVFMKLKPTGACLDLFDQRPRKGRIALAKETDIHRNAVGGLQHPGNMPRTGRTGGGVRTRRRAGTTAQHAGHAGIKGIFDLLRANPVNMGINPACGDDIAFTGNNLGPRADDDINTGLNIRVSGLADPGNAPPGDADIGFDNPGIIKDQRVGDHGINRTFGAGCL